MKLKAYLETNNITRTAFAVQLGISRASVNRYINDERIPEKEIMRAIHDATAGEVTANDFFDLAAGTAAA